MSSLLLKELIVIFLFVVTAAGLVQYGYGIPKTRPRTSSIMQFMFYFWSSEISRNILRNQKTLSVRFIYSKQLYVFEPYLDLYESLYDFFAEIRNYSLFFLAFFASSFRVTEED